MLSFPKWKWMIQKSCMNAEIRVKMRKKYSLHQIKEEEKWDKKIETLLKKMIKINKN